MTVPIVTQDVEVNARPILVTGSHRSGTTWVGSVLNLSGEVHGVHEPFNPTFPRSWLAEPPPTWFHYVDPASEPAMADQLEAVLSLRPPVRAMAARSHTWRHLAATAREAALAQTARARRRRPLLKDPIAFFSAEWLADRFATMNVVMVRHPAAFVASLKRLGWSFDFTNLTRQPALLAGPIASFADEVNAASRGGLDLIDQGVLLWRVINSTALHYRQHRPEWSVLRYEDLASEPLAGFERLFAQLGLSWSPLVVAGVLRLTSGKGASPIPDGDKGGVERDSSAAMWTWQDRLSTEEIARVQEGSADVAEAFYDEDDWRRPPSPRTL